MFWRKKTNRFCIKKTKSRTSKRRLKIIWRKRECSRVKNNNLWKFRTIAKFLSLLWHKKPRNAPLFSKNSRKFPKRRAIWSKKIPNWTINSTIKCNKTKNLFKPKIISLISKKISSRSLNYVPPSKMQPSLHFKKPKMPSSPSSLSIQIMKSKRI